MTQPQFRGISQTSDNCQVVLLIPKGVEDAGCTEVRQSSDCSECCLGFVFFTHRWINGALPERIMVCLQRSFSHYFSINCHSYLTGLLSPVTYNHMIRTLNFNVLYVVLRRFLDYFLIILFVFLYAFSFSKILIKSHFLGIIFPNLNFINF